MAGQQLRGSEGTYACEEAFSIKGRSMMSVEQWGVLALFVLLPLLEGVARFRRAHATNGRAIEHVGEVRTSPRGSSLPNRDVDHPVVVAAKQRVVSPPLSLRPPLPQLVPSPAISLSRLAASRTSYKDTASIEAHTTNGKSVAGDPVMQWLRPVRNLRHAIVVATILGPPRQ
jgi:hypothetical protein